MKIKTNRLIASGLLSLVFILEMFVMRGLFEQVGTSSLAVGHLFVVYGAFLVPVFAILIGNPVFEKAGAKYAVVYSAVLYVCVSILMYSPANTLYNAGLGTVLGTTSSTSTTAGYFILAAKVVLIIAAIIASVPPQVTTISFSGSISRANFFVYISARASLKFFAPKVMEYWCGPCSAASFNASRISCGGSKSGNP